MLARQALMTLWQVKSAQNYSQIHSYRHMYLYVCVYVCMCGVYVGTNFFCVIFVILGFELRASGLLGKCSTT
jgi:hypothetical protein